MTKTAAYRPKLMCMNDIEEREMTWLWHPYLPFGAASMCFGPGGIGKSHISCEIASMVTTGRNFPGQEGRREPKNVLIMSAEDDAHVVLKPRLRKAGADMKRVFFPDNTFVLDPQGVGAMEDYMKECEATIVFIDPLVSYMGGKIDINKANETRTLMGALHAIAQRTFTSIIIFHHERKASEGRDNNKAMGSADLINAVRSTMYVTYTPDGQKVMRHVKSNYSALGQSILFTFDNEEFQWGDFIDEDGLVETSKTERGKADAEAFLKDILRAGPVPAKMLKERAKDEHISVRALARAKEGLVSIQQVYDNGVRQFFWRLKE